MSFSSNIKEELSRNETGARHCKIAEIAGFLRFGGNISLDSDPDGDGICCETFL